MDKRICQFQRKTKETDISLEINLDGNRENKINSGIGFLDHLINAFSFHANFDLKLLCKGDLQIDDHHTVEDCALALGSAIDKALGDRSGIARFGYAYAPLDEALVRAVIDFSGRSFSSIDLKFNREKLGELSTENISHFFQSLATTAKATIHIDQIKGENDHHKAEAAFKALALAFRKAIVIRGEKGVASTKGSLI